MANIRAEIDEVESLENKESRTLKACLMRGKYLQILEMWLKTP